MNQTSGSPQRDKPLYTDGNRKKSGTLSHKDRAIAAMRAASVVKGILLGGAAYLLGTYAFPFGALPLGIAFLCASSSFTPYILAGVCLSSFHGSNPLPFWVGMILWALTLLFRVGFYFFVDRPLRDDGRIRREAKPQRSAHALLSSLLDSLWGKELDDTVTDYYCGKRNTPAKRDEDRVDATPAEATEETPAVSLFGENIFLRMLTGSLIGFGYGLCLMIYRGFTVYDLLATLLMTVSVPIFTFLLSPCFEAAGKELLFSRGTPDAIPRGGHTYLLHHFPALTMVSALLLVILCAVAARSHVLTLFSPYLTLRLAPLLVMVLTLRTSATRGMIPGIIIAILGGLGADPMLSPAFILGALAYGLLRFLSHRVAVLAGCIAALLWTLLGGGVEQLVAYLPTMLLVIPVYLALDHLSSRFPTVSTASANTHGMSDFSSAMEQKTRAEAHRSRLEALSGAFTSLSRLFYELSGQLRRPKITELRRMCDEVFDRHCVRCRHRDACDAAPCHPADVMASRIVTQLHAKGKASSACVSPETAEACIHLERILEDINTRCAKLTEHLMKSEKTEVFAGEYESMAHLINDTLRDDEEEYRCNAQAADRIFDCLTECGVVVYGVVVCGRRNCRVIVRGTRFDRTAGMAEEIHTRMEEICGTHLGEPSFEVEGEHTIMQLASATMIRTAYSGSTVPAGTTEEDELPCPLTSEPSDEVYTPPSVCGDHIALFKSDRACFYALISDGMGSGEDASLTSDICAMFLEKMLSAGNRVELSVKMLGSFIRQKNNGTGDECSATVDLMELDLMSGQAVFAKNGAAPTYVVRGGSVYKLKSRNLPIGILKDSDPQLLRFRMHPGDVVVMVSDGVTHGNDECPWLIDLLSEPLPDSMDTLRLDILRRAIASGSPDDLSAIAVRVEEAR